MNSAQEPLAALAAAVAAEFNDELTLLLNQLALLIDQAGRESPAGHGLITAQQAALRCSRITGQLLDFTRRSGNPRRVEPLGRLLSRS